MKDLLKLISLYPTYIKYWLLFIVIFFMIVSIKTYFYYISIEDAINWVNQRISNIEEETAYTENFLLTYLSSSYADYYLAHESSILFNKEFIIKFEEKIKLPIIKSNTWINKSDNQIYTPQIALQRQN